MPPALPPIPPTTPWTGAGENQGTLIRGRNWEAIVEVDVIDMGTYDQRGWNGNTAIINGGQQGQVLVTFDGMAAGTAAPSQPQLYQTRSVDAIGEVKRCSPATMRPSMAHATAAR